MDADDPVVYLRQSQPTPEEQALAKIVDRHDGDSVPFWMFAAVVVRLRRAMEWIAERTELEATIKATVKRSGRLGLATLAANLALLVTYAAHRVESSGAAEEHAANLERVYEERREVLQRQIVELRDEIAYLRRRLDKISGADMPPNTDADQPDPDRISMRSLQMDSLYTLMAPFSDIPGSTCFNICGSDIECSHDDFGQRCPFCNFGHCSSVRPLSPVVDAGVDASTTSSP